LWLQYYSLDITYFKSSLDSHLLDLLWNKYWVNTLSSSPLLGNRDYVAGQVADLGEIVYSFPSMSSAVDFVVIFAHVSRRNGNVMLIVGFVISMPKPTLWNNNLLLVGLLD